MPTNADRFAIANALRLEAGPGGLTRAAISTPAAEAEIYLHGAHIARWTPRGAQPALFLSSKSLYEPGKAIRGGVPVIFPWFGPRGGGKAGPMHGFARTAAWTVEATALRGDGSVEIGLALMPNDATRALGFDNFQLRFRAVIGQSLEMELETRNDAAETLVLEEALHTYYAIGDIHQVSVSGLRGVTYIDKTDSFQRKQQSADPIRISGETDRVYLNTAAACAIEDAVWKRRIVVEKSGSDTTVVWNPWMEKTKSLTDMAPDDWKQMICVETANAADNAVHLAPGATHKLRASVHLE